jgi:hypothetical protein
MAVWSTKRQLLYGGGVIASIGLIIAGGAFLFLHRSPTCSDGVKNGMETGIDCGGACQKICTADALLPIVLWSKVFNISGDLYTAVANVQNPNVNSKNSKAQYSFKIYDENGKMLIEKVGQTSIPKNKTFAIFEPGIILKDVHPQSVDFTFTSFSSWEKDAKIEPQLSLTHLPLADVATLPRIQGSISNNSFEDVSRVELNAFLLDDKENVIAASRTFVDNLKKSTSQDFFFTWPKPFSVPVSKVTVTYRLL